DRIAALENMVKQLSQSAQPALGVPLYSTAVEANQIIAKLDEENKLLRRALSLHEARAAKPNGVIMELPKVFKMCGVEWRSGHCSLFVDGRDYGAITEGFDIRLWVATPLTADPKELIVLYEAGPHRSSCGQYS